MKDTIAIIDNFIDIEDRTFNVNLPLSIPEFSNVYYNKDKELGKKELAYVALTQSYNSDIVQKGLKGKELHEAACIKVGLPTNHSVSDSMKEAIKVFNDHYSRGAMGMIKELYISYEITRSAIHMINTVLGNYAKIVQDTLTNKLDPTADGYQDSIKSLNSAIGDILTNIAKVRDISGNIDNDINTLKTVESKVVAIEKNEARPLGGGAIPKSARRHE